MCFTRKGIAHSWVCVYRSRKEPVRKDTVRSAPVTPGLLVRSRGVFPETCSPRRGRVRGGIDLLLLPCRRRGLSPGNEVGVGSGSLLVRGDGGPRRRGD